MSKEKFLKELRNLKDDKNQENDVEMQEPEINLFKVSSTTKNRNNMNNPEENDKLIIENVPKFSTINSIEKEASEQDLNEEQINEVLINNMNNKTNVENLYFENNKDANSNIINNKSNSNKNYTKDFAQIRAGNLINVRKLEAEVREVLEEVNKHKSLSSAPKSNSMINNPIKEDYNNVEKTKLRSSNNFVYNEEKIKNSLNNKENELINKLTLLEDEYNIFKQDQRKDQHPKKEKQNSNNISHRKMSEEVTKLIMKQKDHLKQDVEKMKEKDEALKKLAGSLAEKVENLSGVGEVSEEHIASQFGRPKLSKALVPKVNQIRLMKNNFLKVL